VPLILLNKPYRVLSQFTNGGTRRTLADYVPLPGVYPAGRLDFDSEGLLLLTDDGRLQARISQPRSKIVKSYLAQVEGSPDTKKLILLESGVKLKDGPARALSARTIEAPEWLWPRDPPIRYRKNVPETWLEIHLAEGRNRQVRRMTAGVGLPTLRLIRYSVGPWTVEGLAPGAMRSISESQAWRDLDELEDRRHARPSRA
jgi:23S rRNA pseudouridine2457 synthase